TPDKVLVVNPDGPLMKVDELPPAKPGAEARLSLSSEPKYIEVRALEGKMVDAYSDFLVHDMGAALADGVAQDGSKSSEWRTAPLWGLRMRKFYMHDGRAKKLEEAIALHGGQAADSVKEYGKLSAQEKNDLLAFLNSL
ncbi:MAG: hypothetical protein K2X81_13575, partial [Candidatus Obscuribacterales bacterium]|nr:hypothetical protein [Candidatus Obscuribacterales bacterium]